MGLFAAPEWKRQKYNRFEVRKGSRPGFPDVKLSRLEEALEGHHFSKQDQPLRYIWLPKVLSFVTDISIPSATQSPSSSSALAVCVTPPFPFLGYLAVLKPPHFISGELRAAKSCYGHTPPCLKWRQLMELKDVNKTKGHLEHSLNNVTCSPRSIECNIKCFTETKQSQRRLVTSQGLRKEHALTQEKSTRNKVGPQEVPCIADLTDLHLVCLRSFQGWQK